YPPIVYSIFDWQVILSLYTIGVFISRLIGKPLLNHATIAWFFFISKKPSRRIRRLFSFFHLQQGDKKTPFGNILDFVLYYMYSRKNQKILFLQNIFNKK
ncbi:MAG: hypothetical protein IJF44_04835, partial [Clostridia bacterium]|nr:hypothetical protein [Clostridia bacterium]